MKESDISRAIIKDLKEMGCFVWKNWSGPFSMRGISDVLGCLPNGRMLCVEVKTEAGRVSRYQERFIEEVNKVHGLGFVAKSVEEVRERLAKVGVRPKQRSLF